MQISTSLLFDRAMNQMSSVQNDLNHTQAQISSGKQVLNPSDAPSQAATIQRLNGVIAQQANYTQTLQTVQSRLQGEDTTLSSVSDLLTRAKELAVQASNGTLNATDRQSLAVELKGIRDQMLSLANSKDSNGNYYFSGSKLNQPPFSQDSKGNVSYQGDQTQMYVQVGDQRSLPLNRSGTNVFVGVTRTDSTGQKSTQGFFGAMDDLIAGVTNSDAAAMTRGVGEMDTLQNGVSLAHAAVGTDLNVVDEQKQVIDSTTLTLKTTLSNVQDLDMASAITQMNKQMLSLEASQSSFAKISQLTLFSFLK